MRVVAERGGRNRSETLEAPFTGRDTELRLLKDLYAATAREQRIRLVSLTGQAGVGKSRVAWEFEKYLDGLVDEVYWNVGRSPAYGDGITFWALGEMVRGRAGLLATDDEPTTRRKIAESVAAWVPDEGERRWVETALLALLAVEPAPPGGRESLFAAWRTYFERIGADGTAVVLLFEDLHWADPGLLDFIDHLLEWSTGVPILIVTLARPELLERRPAWGAGRRNFVALHLDPLPDEAVGELLDGLVAGLRRRPPRRSSGARTASRCTPSKRSACWSPTTARRARRDVRPRRRPDRTGGPRDPPRAHRRATRRPRPDRSGAPPGRGRARPELHPDRPGGRRRGPTGPSSSRACAVLVRREILVQQVDQRSPERGQYSFVQALVREVAYSTLAKRDRRDRHLAAARHFESLGEDELVGALAAHYLGRIRGVHAGSRGGRRRRTGAHRASGGGGTGGRPRLA